MLSVHISLIAVMGKMGDLPELQKGMITEFWVKGGSISETVHINIYVYIEIIH